MVLLPFPSTRILGIIIYYIEDIKGHYYNFRIGTRPPKSPENRPSSDELMRTATSAEPAADRFSRAAFRAARRSRSSGSSSRFVVRA